MGCAEHGYVTGVIHCTFSVSDAVFMPICLPLSIFIHLHSPSLLSGGTDSSMHDSLLFLCHSFHLFTCLYFHYCIFSHSSPHLLSLSTSCSSHASLSTLPLHSTVYSSSTTTPSSYHCPSQGPVPLIRSSVHHLPLSRLQPEDHTACPGPVQVNNTAGSLSTISTWLLILYVL